MTTPDRAYVEARLESYIDTMTDDNLVAGRCIKGVGVDGARVSVKVVLGYPAAGRKERLQREIEAHLEADPNIETAVVDLTWKVVPHSVQGKLTPLPEVKNIIAIASGKGGVGKSTTAANLALALAVEGAQVGILDADIYGPSQPRMMGLSGKPESSDGKSIEPKVNYGIQTMSIGYLIEEDTPMVWRGPMVTQALQQLLSDTRWRGLDYLFIDMPPGTGDIQLTLAQQVPVSGAIIVTTPQDIALLDARKGLKMFNKVEVPVLGVVENMSTHICSNCGHEEHIFGAGGGARMAEEYEIELLGSLPLDRSIRELTDGGKPSVATDPESAIALTYRAIACRAAARLARQARSMKVQFPNIVISNT